tara:strand:+ start:1310 stop:2098 length:789 start_codon:yes stop_codon:yes gene_type:complete
MKKKIKIEPILALRDNYVWLISSKDSDYCVVIDPGESAPVIDILRKRSLQLEAILITHKHRDHTGGILKLKKYCPDVVVYGPAKEPINGVDITLQDGDKIVLMQLNINFNVMDVPGHTEGHVAYYGENSLFCGDTLFSCGCGRVFSGSYDQLNSSLEKFLQLPQETECYCGHEYTKENIGFAKLVEPLNTNLLRREEEVRLLRLMKRPTIPSTLKIEALTNPFLRTNKKTVKKAAEKWIGHSLKNNAQVFFALRTWKDKDYD